MRTNNRLLSILCALGESTQPLSLTELAAAVELPKSTSLRFLRSLEPDGWIVRNAGGDYVLGPAVIVLASQYLSGDAVLSAAPPVMRTLRDQIDETVSLSRAMNLQRTCLHEYASAQQLRLVIGVGSVGPLHAGASGLLLLAHMPPELRQEVYAAGLPRFTAITPVTAEELEQECATITERGWAISHGQKTAGGIAIAVPVADPNAPHHVSALGIFGPQARFDPAVDEERWVHALLQAAEAIEREAGVHLQGGRAR